MKKINILIYSKDLLFAQLLANSIKTQDSYEFLGIVENYSELIKNLQISKPDIIIINIGFIDFKDINLCTEIKKYDSKISVIYWGKCKSEEIFINAIKVGVSGVLDKNISLEEFYRSLWLISHGYLLVNLKNSDYYTPDFLKSNADINKLPKLSEREIEILKLVARGQNNKKIAKFLCISENTVRNHLYNIFSKINVHCRTQAVLWAVNNNCINI